MFEAIKKVMLEKYSLHFDKKAKDFTDFNGTVYNDKKETFEIEGSIEWFEKEKEIAYSVLFYDLTRHVEYDGIIGTFCNVNKEDIDRLLAIIFEPNFIECK